MSLTVIVRHSQSGLLQENNGEEKENEHGMTALISIQNSPYTRFITR